ncbi:protein HEG-like isoform X2 [Apteryx mantelli]|uniref:Protein HEG-like isoform X2 n=1 Tax=Apteryx mantelli TaxID=2696672 RepID=A0ABM4E6B4_9AVES
MRGGSHLLIPFLCLQLGAPSTGKPGCGPGHPCPPWSSCVEQPGGATCRCEPGFTRNASQGCVPARTFPGRLSLRYPVPIAVSPALAVELSQTATELERLFQRILGALDSYVSSSVLEPQSGSEWVTILHNFSVLSSVTARQVEEAVAQFQERCQTSDPSCRFLRDIVSYRSLSLCELEPCDPVSTACIFQDGLARCSCRPGYRSAHPMDRACTACRSGFRLQDGSCRRCPFGFSGWQCEEPFLLALVLVSISGGALLLMLLLLTCGAPAAPAWRPSWDTFLGARPVAGSTARTGTARTTSDGPPPTHTPRRAIPRGTEPPRRCRSAERGGGG